MRKNCRSLLLASLALTCGLLASCLSSGPEKPLGAMADAMEKNDSAAFLAQMDMPLFAANEARNMTNENEALNMLDSLGQDLGLGGMDQLLGSALNMEDKLRKSLTRGVSTGELMAHCRKAERPDCPWVPESLRNAKVVELGPDAAVASVTTPAGMTSWLALRKQGETWRVVGRAVMENMARAFAQAGSQTKAAPAAPAKAQVTGVVRDAAGNPMIGVTVTVKGTLVGVSTGVDGSYTIPADKDAMLLFSYIGYRNQEEPVGQRTQIDVTMQEDQLVMDEVVVVGYGTLKKRNIVGAVENLAGDAVENRPNADITRSLQGQIPGLNIVQTDGKAAHGGQVTIRGVNNSFKARVISILMR